MPTFEVYVTVECADLPAAAALVREMFDEREVMGEPRITLLQPVLELREAGATGYVQDGPLLLICPSCDHEHDEAEGPVAVDTSERWSQSRMSGRCITVDYGSGDDGDGYGAEKFRCAGCSVEVALPESWQTDGE